MSAAPTRVVALLAVGVALTSPASAQGARASASLGAWVRAKAIPLRGVDEPYADSAFAFLRPLVGTSRVLALGELIHRGHEPLAFRNEVVRYAVTHLGFTAVALESGTTEVAAVDGFIQGGAGNVDSILRVGLNWNFGSLPENRQLVLWLREYNAQAARKVRLYGFDLTGGDPANQIDLYLGAPKAVWAALDYVDRVAPRPGAALRARLTPLMTKFTPMRYREYSAVERGALHAGLDSLERVLVADSSRYVRASSTLQYARARRDAWTARQLDALLALSPSDDPAIARARNILRDSLMAENIKWVLRTEGDGGRVIVFAHNAHLIDAPFSVWQAAPNGGGLVPVGAPYPMAGQHLRAWFGRNVVVMASTTSRTTGWDASPSDPASFDAALARAEVPAFVLDLRSGDTIPEVRDALLRAWPFRMHTRFQRVVPREAADAVVYFDRVTATKDH